MKVTDYKTLIDIILVSINKSDYTHSVLGEANGHKIYLIHRKELKKDGKNVLITAGFHGDEPAGPWGLCKFIERGDLKKLDVNISLIPVANPSGFVRDKRDNKDKEKSNRGFLDKPPKLSEESKVLVNNISELKYLAKDGLLTLHETDVRPSFYLYVYGSKKSGIPGKLIESAKKYFKILTDGKYETKGEKDYKIKNGISWEVEDGSFEHYMSTLDVPIAITSETPIVDVPISDRVYTNADLIKTFVESIKG